LAWQQKDNKSTSSHIVVREASNYAVSDV
jgi:hypothetical protein